MALTKASYSMITGAPFNVKDFGAVGDGVHDDTDAIQAAVNAATQGIPSGTVYFPPNDVSQFYKTTAQINITKPIKIVGSGVRATTIIATGLADGEAVFNCDNAVSTAYFYEISDLSLWTSDYVGNCINLTNCSYTLIKNVWARQAKYGCYITGTICFSNFFEQFHGYSMTNSTVRVENFSGGGQYKFDSCTFTGDTGFVLSPSAFMDGLCFTACNFEQCVTQSVYIGGSVQGLSFLGCRTEGCNGAIDIGIQPDVGETVGGLTITGCSFETDAGACVPIYIGAGGTVRGFSITGNHGGYAGNPYFVYLNGEGESGLIAGNSTTYSTSLVNAKRNGVVIFGNEYSTGGGGKNVESWGSQRWGVEYGTWVPTDGSGAGLTFTVANAVYNRVGRVVTLAGQFTFPSTANGSNVQISGLPFAVSTGTFTGQLGTDQGGAFNTVLVNSSSGDYIYFRNSSNANPTNANFSGKLVFFQLTYITSN